LRVRCEEGASQYNERFEIGQQQEVHRKIERSLASPLVPEIQKGYEQDVQRLHDLNHHARKDRRGKNLRRFDLLVRQEPVEGQDDHKKENRTLDPQQDEVQNGRHPRGWNCMKGEEVHDAAARGE
jgi:hypothetical protein